MTDKRPFWQRKSLEEMSEEEWESLCDGCGRCCLHSFEDEDTGEFFQVPVACKLLDVETSRCTDYAGRHAKVPDCVRLSARHIGAYAWLPQTCAYRLLHCGEPLRWWHPLVSGDPNTVHDAGISIRGRVLSENDIDPMDMVGISLDEFLADADEALGETRGEKEEAGED